MQKVVAFDFRPDSSTNQEVRAEECSWPALRRRA